MVERAAISKEIVSTKRVVASNFEGNQRVNFEYLPDGVQVSFWVNFQHGQQENISGLNSGIAQLHT